MMVRDAEFSRCRLLRKRLNLLTEYLQAYRVEHDLSQNELAERIGISKSSISKIMTGKQSAVTLDFIEKLALLTGEDPGALACLALGRPAQIAGDREQVLRRVAELSREYSVLWDVVLLAVRNIDRPAKLAAVVELLKE